MEPVLQAYGAIAEQYIELFGSSADVHADDLALIAGYLAVRHGPVLDVGCGPGHLTAYLRSLGVAATGIDLVPSFIDHARAAHPDGRYELGSMRQLPLADGTAVGMLAWFSLIHVPPDELDTVLGELRRAMAPDATLVIGFFSSDTVEPFAHKVLTAYRWPVDEFSARLAHAGFTEVDRQWRQGDADAGVRPAAALVATAR